MKKKLSVAYTVYMLPIAQKYHEYINDIYYTDGRFDSARGSVKMDEGEQLSYNELTELKKLGIKLNYVLNSPYLPNRQINNYDEIAQHLIDNKEFIDIVTVNNLLLANNKQFMGKLKEYFEIKNSVNNHINTLYKVKEMCERFPDIDNIIIDRSVNRNPELITEMAELCHSYGKKITVLLNEGCVFNCIYKRDCDLTFSSVDHSKPEDNETFNCYKANFKKQDAQYLKSPWMTAEGVELLENTVDIFKISGRYDPPEEIEKRIRYYLFNDRTAYLREIMDKVLNKKDELFTLSMFDLSMWGMTNVLTSCKNDCMNCNKCEEFIENFKKDTDDE